MADEGQVSLAITELRLLLTELDSEEEPKNMDDWINLNGAKQQIGDLLSKLEKEHDIKESKEIQHIKRLAGIT